MIRFGTRIGHRSWVSAPWFIALPFMLAYWTFILILWACIAVIAATVFLCVAAYKGILWGCTQVGEAMERRRHA